MVLAHHKLTLNTIASNDDEDTQSIEFKIRCAIKESRMIVVDNGRGRVRIPKQEDKAWDRN
jgi:hypothetical protein